MSLELVMYVIAILVNVSCASTVFLGVLALCTLLVLPLSPIIIGELKSNFIGEEYEKLINNCKGSLKTIFKLLIICVFLVLIIPSKQDMYGMMAVKFIKQTIKTEQSQEILDKSFKLINVKLDDLLKE